MLQSSLGDGSDLGLMGSHTCSWCSSGSIVGCASFACLSFNKLMNAFYSRMHDYNG